MSPGAEAHAHRSQRGGPDGRPRREGGDRAAGSRTRFAARVPLDESSSCVTARPRKATSSRLAAAWPASCGKAHERIIPSLIPCRHACLGRSSSSSRRDAIEATVATTARPASRWKRHAVSVAGLTLYDMLKSVERGATLTDVRLVRKDRWGSRGTYRWKGASERRLCRRRASPTSLERVSAGASRED